MSDVAELAARLVAIESIDPDIAQGGSGELGVARFVAVPSAWHWSRHK